MQREFKISLSQEHYSDVVYLSQYDDDYDVIFHVTNKYSAADVGGKSAKFTGTRSDGLGFTFTSTAVGSSVSFHINTSLTACAGTHTAEIIFYNNDGLKFGSANIQVIVEKAAHPDGTIDADEEQLRELAEQVQEIVDTAAATVKGEAEAWAVGQRDGVDVPSTDPAYENNAKYYAEQAAQTAEEISGVTDQVAQNTSDISDLKEDLDSMLDENYVIHPVSIYGNNNPAMVSNMDGSFTAGTTNYGNTTFGRSMTTLPPGDYYLYGVSQGIAFITTDGIGSTSYDNRVFENTDSEPKLFHNESEISVCLGYRITERPSSSVTIYPSLIQLIPKTDRALLMEGILPNGTDLDNVKSAGVYLLNDSYTYIHTPDYSGDSVLIVYTTSNRITQTVYRVDTTDRTFTPNISIRYGTKAGGFTVDWKYLCKRQYGMRTAFIGDSIIWGRNGDHNSPSSSEYRTHYQIPDAISYNLGIVCENMGVGNMGWIKEGDGNVKAYDVLSGLTLSDYDALFFSLGVNDGFSPLGTWDSEDETTIMGQFNKCIKYIMTNRPNLRVIVIAPLNGKNIGEFPDYWYGPRENPNGYVSRKILSDTLKRACDYYWIPYIEQYDGPINPYSIQTLIGLDGVHPNNAGYLALGRWMSEKIGGVL